MMSLCRKHRKRMFAKPTLARDARSGLVISAATNRSENSRPGAIARDDRGGLTIRATPYDAGGSAPRKSSPATLEASHLLTGPTGCPGFEISRLARDDPPPRTPPVTICPGFRYSVQIVESEACRQNRFSTESETYTVSSLESLTTCHRLPCRLNRSTQHFILDEKMECIQ